jgi:hypothetical protein
VCGSRVLQSGLRLRVPGIVGLELEQHIQVPVVGRSLIAAEPVLVVRHHRDDKRHWIRHCHSVPVAKLDTRIQRKLACVGLKKVID